MQVIPYEAQVVQIQTRPLTLVGAGSQRHQHPLLTWLILPRGEFGLKRHKKVAQGVVRQVSAMVVSIIRHESLMWECIVSSSHTVINHLFQN